FGLIRLGRSAVGAVLVGVSLAVKPLAIVLPVALLSRRDTRKAGVLSLAAAVAPTVLALGFLALRARDATLLSPLPVFSNFGRRAAGFQALPENFAPQALLQRLTRTDTPLQRGVVLVGVGLALLLANESVKQRAGGSWEVFSFALLFCALVGPISWSHYQV